MLLGKDPAIYITEHLLSLEIKLRADVAVLSPKSAGQVIR